ncbi:type VII secretion system-associated protein [Saccharopolyspora sp. 5N708]|uniref:type VII secretion system-associated protein n=1 Tax=Saccharopolyspora sp. 5N708 TaxID=3457424 RepID=UPI003FD393BD
MNDEPERPDPTDNWMFMVDPAWQPADEDDRPPIEAVVGGWFVAEDGKTSLFMPNPDYQPSLPDLPTDPVDAALQLLARGEADGDEVLSKLPEVILGVALDERDVPVVAPAPDDVLSLLVTTSPARRARVNARDWWDVTVDELADVLPDEGIDVLLNPGGPASMRILASAIRRSVGEGGEDRSG